MSTARMPLETVLKLLTWPSSILPSSPVGVTIRFWKKTLAFLRTGLG